MRCHWDERARANAFHYIASWQPEWDADAFFVSGEEDYDALIQPVLKELKVDPPGRVAADIGCGAGRITRALAAQFDQVHGVDVSPEMLTLARSLSPDLPNVHWHLGSGDDLSVLDTSGVDFVFSYLVLQHIPEREAALDLVAEMLRVLRENGAFLFQFNSLKTPTMNWKGRLLWRVIDSLRASRSTDRLANVVSRAFGVDPLAAGPTWRGVVLDPREVVETVRLNGGTVTGLTGGGSQMTWCYGQKIGPLDI